MRIVKASEELTDAEVEALAGVLLTDASYHTLIDDDADVLKPDGELLLRFRKRIIKPALCAAAYDNLHKAAIRTDNRGIAAGQLDKTEAPIRNTIGERTQMRYKSKKRDGTLSHQVRAAEVNSGIVGFYDRSTRFPYCRQTAFTMAERDKVSGAIPFLQSVSAQFKKHVRHRYDVQMGFVDRTSEDYRFPGTAFTTITVNKNWQTAVHRDRGDLEEGFGVMSVVRGGEYSGGYLVFPQYGVAVNMETSDVLFSDVHEWHGNTAIVGRGNYVRLAMVFYYRKNMVSCGNASEELERVKTRVVGTPLN